jgi:hypothetical protein
MGSLTGFAQAFFLFLGEIYGQSQLLFPSIMV